MVSHDDLFLVTVSLISFTVTVVIMGFLYMHRMLREVQRSADQIERRTYANAGFILQETQKILDRLA